MNTLFSTDEETPRGSLFRSFLPLLTIGSFVMLDGKWMIPGWALLALVLACTRRGRARLRSFWSRSLRERAGYLLGSALMFYLYSQGRGLELGFELPWLGHAVLWVI